MDSVFLPGNSVSRLAIWSALPKPGLPSPRSLVITPSPVGRSRCCELSQWPFSGQVHEDFRGTGAPASVWLLLAKDQNVLPGRVVASIMSCRDGSWDSSHALGPGHPCGSSCTVSECLDFKFPKKEDVIYSLHQQCTWSVFTWPPP